MLVDFESPGPLESLVLLSLVTVSWRPAGRASGSSLRRRHSFSAWQGEESLPPHAG